MSEFMHAPQRSGKAVTSVVRQRLSQATPRRPASHRHDALEREADRTATQVMAGTDATHIEAPPLGRGRGNTSASIDHAPAIVTHALNSAGATLPGAERAFYEDRFGHDFHQVRIHHDAQADRSARAVNAQAYTVGEHVVFRQGHFAPGSSRGRELIAHELAHVVQQRTGGVSIIQRAVVDDVRDKLSYGFLDWAITDEEANDALALLGTIPEADLPAQLALLGTKYVTRLLDNLPDAAKSGEVYNRIVKSLGVAGTGDYVDEQLSFGLFDWGISNDEVARVFNVMANLPDSEREAFLTDLAASKNLDRLLRNASYGQFQMYMLPWMNGLTAGALDDDQRRVMRTVAKRAPDAPIDILTRAAEIRYDVTVGPSTMTKGTPVAPDADKLRQTYMALDNLPDAHVAGNQFIQRIGQFEEAEKDNGSITRGRFSATQRELASNTRAGDVINTMIHEAGHAVDEQLGWSNGPEPAKPERGGWKEYASHRDCAIDMVQDADGGIKNVLKPTQRGNVINDMTAAMGAQSAEHLKRDVKAHPWFSALPRADRGEVLDDPALEAIPVGLDTPWFETTNGGEHLGDHIYQQSYGKTWVRYMHAARDRMIRRYQFRDAGEWFAVCYRAYYDPDNKTKGELLQEKDPNTKQYFDTVVDKLAASR
ncbi:eCIS core domain-containing protein [Nitrogeniibacter aestuarii]|uniref:eCIS core domain-containing protein n=1 Tax=Nitrogeniibacter aestuarii TaxID=2815343 RepID=UPI001D11BB72|nr:DUF4157 domain-containing protein [Nitrogeniibacter aestuarii]